LVGVAGEGWLEMHRLQGEGKVEEKGVSWVGFYHYQFYFQGIKSPIERTQREGWATLVRGLGLGIEGRYRTHSRRSGLLPLY
jgi:hypothetical protein